MKFSRIYLLSYYNSLQHVCRYWINQVSSGLNLLNYCYIINVPPLNFCAASIAVYMRRCDSSRHFYPLTSFQIGDLQSYLSDLTLFLAPDSKTFYVLVDNRPWLQDLASRPAHLWQLMVTKSRMSPFANTRGRKGSKNTKESIDHKTCSKPSIRSQNFKKWFSVVDAAALSRKRALLPVKKLRSSLLANSKLHRTLYGFIVFQVMWKDVRGINYLNELQTDTSLAIEAKYMKRWEFDSISQSVKCITSWFPGTLHEQSLLKDHLNSMIGDEFHDAPKEFPNYPSKAEENPSNPTPLSSNLDKNQETLKDQISEEDLQTPPPYKRRKLTNSAGIDIEVNFYTDISQITKMPSLTDCEETADPTESRDVLLLFRFNNPQLPFELKKIIVSDLRLLTLLEAGLPSWVIFFQSYPVFCHMYRPWMCPLARALYVIISIVTVVIGFYDLYKNVPVLKATASRLCGPLIDWIETWEMVSRIKYLGTMLFLHNSEKALVWVLMMTRTVRGFVGVVMGPMVGPVREFVEVVVPVWDLGVGMGRQLGEFVWVLVGSLWDLVESLVEGVMVPVWFVLSVVWTIVTTIMYPIFWFIWGILYAPISLILGVSNFVGFMYNQIYDLFGEISTLLSDIFMLASNAESAVHTYEVSIWRSLWNDLFSQVFRAVRSILNGFVAFFAACNRHRLSIYNHLHELIRRVNQPNERFEGVNSSRESQMGSRRKSKEN
ncbi:hypothetical protein LXL04_038085 [Taraxacum kok-saghyz]